MLRLGGNSEDAEDDEEGDTELRGNHLLEISTISAPSPGRIFEGRRVDPVLQKLYVTSARVEGLRSDLWRKDDTD